MNKKNLTTALGSFIASSLLAATLPTQAGENPFGLSTINPIHLATADEKAKEGKCGEGKCGGNKPKAAAESDKAVEDKQGGKEAKAADKATVSK